LPPFIKVTGSTRKRAFKDAKRIWIRHSRFGHTTPSSWTWEKDGNVPSGYSEGGGMFGGAIIHVKALLGERESKLPVRGMDDELAGGIPIPLYVRVVKI
jgi:hypothetical protein